MTAGDQFGRKASLIVVAGEKGIDLSSMRFTFTVEAADVQTPNNVRIRVYNLSDTTMKQVRKEYQRVVLQAGYVNGNFGIIFDGTIKQIRIGRENGTDRYMDIIAADGDIAYNFGLVNTTMAAGSTPASQMQEIQRKAFEPHGVGLNPLPTADMTGGVLPRGKVLYGMGREYMRDLAATSGTSWSIQNGKVTVIPLTGYLPDEAVVLTSKTGLIGLPEQTDNGIYIKALLNPLFKVGTRVKIDNKSIEEMTINIQYTAINLPAHLQADGFYRILVVEHQGDTRGDPWYSNLVCLSIDPTTPASRSVQKYG